MDREEQQDTARAELSSVAECSSMCAFVLIAGLHRSVLPQARVMVHGIWLGDRRKDAQSASYSADDLALFSATLGGLCNTPARWTDRWSFWNWHCGSRRGSLCIA